MGGSEQQADGEFEASLGCRVASSLGYGVNSVCHLELHSETLFQQNKSSSNKLLLLRKSLQFRKQNQT